MLYTRALLPPNGLKIDFPQRDRRDINGGGTQVAGTLHDCLRIPAGEDKGVKLLPVVEFIEKTRGLNSIKVCAEIFIPEPGLVPVDMYYDYY